MARRLVIALFRFSRTLRTTGSLLTASRSRRAATIVASTSASPLGSFCPLPYMSADCAPKSSKKKSYPKAVTSIWSTWAQQDTQLGATHSLAYFLTHSGSPAPVLHCAVRVDCLRPKRIPFFRQDGLRPVFVFQQRVSAGDTLHGTRRNAALPR